MQLSDSIRKDFIRNRFAGKKITLMGLGLLGRGLGDAKFLAAAGADLIVTDLKTEAELAPSIAALADVRNEQDVPPNIAFHLGGHRLEDFEGRDLIIKAPNTPLDSPFIARARERGIPIEMDAALFVKLVAELPEATGTPRAPAIAPKSTIIGVTGTRGKSTVTHLMYEIIRAAGRTAHLGGNVRDTATLPLIESVNIDKNGSDFVVLELDSWQLQGFEEDRISPHIAIWTNFMPDHMNYYRGDKERYFADKAAIARFQKTGDTFIAPREIQEKIKARFGALAGTFIAADSDANTNDWEIALPGEHNRMNAAFAIAAARAIGVPDDIIKKVLKSFRGLPNRLEFLGEKKGLIFYNDSNATTPEATVVALQTLGSMVDTKNRPIVLIAGGGDKELNFEKLADEIMNAKTNSRRAIKKLILFEGKASEKLKALLPPDFPIAMVENMPNAFAGALAAAAPGDTILLSPAATSFGIFKNEYDRGEQFKQWFEKS